MRKLLSHPAAKAALTFAGITLALVCAYGLLPVDAMGNDASTAVALAAVACLLLVPGVVNSRVRFLWVFRIRGHEPAQRDQRACLAVAAAGLVVLMLLTAATGRGYLAAVTAPASLLLEELIFRGLPLALLLRAQDSAKTRWAVVIISSLTFAVLHFSVIPVMYLDRFVFACMALCLAFKFNSLWPAVLYHTVANIAALATSDFLYRPEYAWLYIPLDILIFAAVFLFCSTSSIRRTSQSGPVKVL